MPERQYRDILYEGSGILARSAAGDTPYLDATILLSSVSGMTREKLIASLPESCPQKTADSFFSAIAERGTGTPVAYIIGKKEFYGREFFIRPGVLVPRPDTEAAVDTALSLIGKGIPDGPVLDLCSGSGCIGITLKAECPHLEVFLADISPNALEVSRINAENLLGHALIQYNSDLFSAIPGKFSIIVSNPPYLTETEMDDTDLVRHGEPPEALAAGIDGLDIIRPLVNEGFEKLSKKGYLIIECGYRQGHDVLNLMEKRGFHECSIVKDLGGRDRVITGRKV